MLVIAFHHQREKKIPEVLTIDEVVSLIDSLQGNDQLKCVI